MPHLEKARLMDDTNAQSAAGSPTSPSQNPGAQPAPAAPRQPYRRQVHHITQEPIDDVEPRYVTLNRYETLEQRGARRGAGAPGGSPSPRSGANHKHMGVATSDPSYMPTAEPAHRVGAAGPAPINYSRYLETPKPGKTIFAGRGRRKSPKRFIPVVVVVVVAALIIWLLFLR